MRRINEIFYSLQGEGTHTGSPSVFLRFSGCNLRCPFCDTDHVEGKMMADEEIAKEINRYPAKWIVLTGGEPSLWIDPEFIEYLKRETGKMVAIETNGSRKLPDAIDWITVSPKIGMPGVGDYELAVAHADELKVIDLGQDLDPYFSYSCVGEDTRMYLQPCFVEDRDECVRRRADTIRRVLGDARWTLSLQTHRLIGIR